MKPIFLLFILTACALPGNRNQVNTQTKPLTSIENIRECVESLMSLHGISAEKSFEVCQKIYRRP